MVDKLLHIYHEHLALVKFLSVSNVKIVLSIVETTSR